MGAKGLLMRKLIVAACLVFASLHSASADAAGVGGFSDADVRQAVRAVLGIPTDHTFTLALEAAPATELPAWDPIAHYVGPQKLPDGRTAYVVLVNDRDSDALADLGHADHAVAAAVASAVFLSVMDAGRAGSTWKARYQKAADDDAKLPSSVSDLYTNRHALVNALADTETIVYAGIGGGDAPSMDEFGNPLTEPIDYGTGLLRLARLGVASARLIELFEYAPALKQHSSQVFVDRWFAEFSAALPDEARRNQLRQLRPLFVADPSANLQASQQQFGQAIVSLAQSLHSDETAAFGLGYDANEIRYNAEAIKSSDEDGKLRYLVSQTSELDGALPSLAGLRQRLSGLSPGDWTKIASVAGQIVDALVPGP